MSAAPKFLSIETQPHKQRGKTSLDSVGDFRLNISLLNCSVKIITKVLANRLGKVIDQSPIPSNVVSLKEDPFAIVLHDTGDPFHCKRKKNLRSQLSQIRF